MKNAIKTFLIFCLSVSWITAQETDENNAHYGIKYIMSFSNIPAEETKPHIDLFRERFKTNRVDYDISTQEYTVKAYIPFNTYEEHLLFLEENDLYLSKPMEMTVINADGKNGIYETKLW